MTRERSLRLWRRWAFALTASSCAAMLSLAACDDGSTPGASSGKLELSLVGQSAEGTSYRLRNAVIMVQGPDQTLFFDTEQAPKLSALSASVVPGTYSIFLQEGWQLQRADDGKMVPASLLSANPDSFSVAAGEATLHAMRFLVGSEMVATDVGSFDIVLDVEEADSEFCSADAECASGEVCCITGFLGSCQRLEDGARCPLPDLTVSADAAQSSLVINTEEFPPDSCAIAEGCVDGAGQRRLLRFSTVTPNIGDADFILGDPASVPGFVFAECHSHFHFEGYARYELLDASGVIVAVGHKQAFCLLDSVPVGLPGAPSEGRFHCGFQGLTRGWADIYDSGLDCQWVDITDVADGSYLLRISINPDRIIEESDYDNNTIEVPVEISDALEAGPAQAWSIAPGFEGAACTPGELVALGCGCDCAGDPMLQICSGSAGCSEKEALALVDDTCGLCPTLEFTCPAGGTYSAMLRSFDGLPMTCDVQRN